MFLVTLVSYIFSLEQLYSDMKKRGLQSLLLQVFGIVPTLWKSSWGVGMAPGSVENWFSEAPKKRLCGKASQREHLDHLHLRAQALKKKLSVWKHGWDLQILPNEIHAPNHRTEGILCRSSSLIFTSCFHHLFTFCSLWPLLTGDVGDAPGCTRRF